MDKPEISGMLSVVSRLQLFAIAVSVAAILALYGVLVSRLSPSAPTTPAATPIPAPAVSHNAAPDIDLDLRELERNPEAYRGYSITFWAKVIERAERDGMTALHVITYANRQDLSDFAKLNLIVLYAGALRELSPEDTVLVVGVGYGSFSVPNAFGVNVTQTVILASSVEERNPYAP
jgi:hypothetical protein